jgi:heat shock protein HslJ
VRRVVIVFAIAALALAGCAFSDLIDDVTPDLDGSGWALTGWAERKVDPVPFRITMRFADDRVVGRSGVNRFAGDYTRGPGTAFAVGDLATTDMAGTPEAMQAEETFRSLLSRVRSYRREGGLLILGDETGQPLLVLTRLDD